MNNLHSVILTNIKILKFNELILNIWSENILLSYKNNGYDIEEKIIVYPETMFKKKNIVHIGRYNNYYVIIINYNSYKHNLYNSYIIKM